MVALEFSLVRPSLSLTSAPPWSVAHTKARCEKKVAQLCLRENINFELPCCRAIHKYRGKTVAFDKPIFPGYVFLQIPDQKRASVRQSDHVANLLDVTDQELFVRQLNEILLAVKANLEIRLAPAIGQGSRVQVRSGPLRGMEGWVENRYGSTVVLLRLDFIGQAAAVQVEASQLELV